MLYKILLGRDKLYIKENPASRLHDILEEVHRISKKSPTSSKFKPTWASVLEVEEEDLDKILQGVISVQDLYNQTKNIVQDHEFLNSDKNNKYLNNIYKALYIVNLQGDMGAFHTHLKSDTLLSLSYISEHIELILKLQNTLLSEEEKEDLLKNIDELIEEFIESNLPADLKSTCTNSLSHIKGSLVHYRIYGAKGLQESITMATGELFLNPSALEHKDDKHIENYFNFIQRINTMVTTSETVIKLTSAMSKLIP